jgi:hypothetical protein
MNKTFSSLAVSILCFSWILDHFDKQEVLGLIVEKMRLFITFENELRPQFSKRVAADLSQ